MKTKKMLPIKILIIISFIFIRCNQSTEPAIDQCLNIECLNGGNCNNGECLCINDYWGEECELTPQQKFYENNITSLDWGPASGSPLNFNYKLTFIPQNNNLTDMIARIGIREDGITCHSLMDGIISSNCLETETDSTHFHCGKTIIDFSFKTADGFNGELDITYLNFSSTDTIVAHQFYSRS